MAIITGVTLWIVAAGILNGPSHVYSEHRLMPTFLFLDGLRVYPPPAQGPFYVPMYPPLSFLFYLPVGLSRDPVTVLRTGSALAALGVLLPVALFLGTARRGSGGALAAALTFLVGVSWIHVSPVLLAALFVHADAPAIFLAGVGIWLLHRALSRTSGLFLAGSLVACALAPWAKQTFVPIVLVPVLALLVRGSRRRAFLALLATVALQVLLFASAGTAFGFRELAFWILEFPALHPWSGPAVEIVSKSSRVMLVEALPLLAIAIGALLARKEPERLLSAWTRSLSGLLMAAGLLLWPTSVLGGVKVGGAPNALAPALYFITCSCLVTLLASCQGDGPCPIQPARGVLVLLAAALGLQGSVEAALIAKRLPGTTWDAEVVAKTVRADPDRFFFPWYPLSTYLASGRLVHCDLGISDRKLAGIAIPSSEILAWVPRDVRFIVCGTVPCPTTLESFEVIRTTEGAQAGRPWTVFQVRRPAAR